MATERDDEGENKPHELRNLFVKEISLVSRAANRRKFLLFKHENGGRKQMADKPLTDEETQEIEEALNTPAEIEEAVLKGLETEVGKALSGTDRNKVIAALRMLGGIDDDTVKALVKQLSEAAKVDANAKKADPPKPNPKPAPERKEAPVSKDDPKDKQSVEVPPEVVELARAGDYEAITKAAMESPGMVRIVVGLLKSQAGQITDLLKFQAETIAKADDDEVARLVDEADLPGMSREDQIKLVKAMPIETRSAWADHAKGIRANIAGGVLAKKKGTSRRGDVAATTAYDDARERAREIVAKGDGKLTEAQAIEKVLREDPELAHRYRAEVRSGEVTNA